MTEAKLVVKLIQDSPQGYVALSQLKSLFRLKYGRDLGQRRVKRWVTSIPRLYIDNNPVKDSIHVRVKAKKNCISSISPQLKLKANPQPAALIKTLNAHGGEICLHKLKSAYRTITNNRPPYPLKRVRKWILSTKGVEIKEGVVRLESANNPMANANQQSCATKVPKKKIKKKKAPKKNLQKKNPLINLPIRNDCYYGMAAQRNPGRKGCIMHFGLTSQSKKAFWMEKDQIKSNHSQRRYNFSEVSPYSRAIVSGYLAKKIKKAGGQKAARKARNLARLRKTHNPTPAVPSSHAQQRYRERGSSSSPIYKQDSDRSKAIVVTYIPVKRENYSDAKKSKLTIQLEVDRMSRLPKKSDLPRSKLSSRDAYLLKLSSKATKQEECRRRSAQREKAYKNIA